MTRYRDEQLYRIADTVLLSKTLATELALPPGTDLFRWTQQGVFGEPRDQASSWTLIEQWRTPPSRNAMRALARELATRGTSLRAQAARAGLPIATMYRLLNGECEKITQGTLDAVYRIVRPELHADVAASVLSPGARYLLRCNDEARRIEMHALLGGPGRRIVSRKGQFHELVDDGLFGKSYLARYREFRYLLLFIRHRFATACRDFDALLRRKGMDSGVPGDRGDLAYARIVAPLLAWRDGLIERHWSEMRGKAGDWKPLREFVVAGIKRERLLLQRLPDEQRAQAAADNPSSAIEDSELRLMGGLIDSGSAVNDALNNLKKLERTLEVFYGGDPEAASFSARGIRRDSHLHPWRNRARYEVGDHVRANGAIYVARAEHESSADTQPGSGLRSGAVAAVWKRVRSAAALTT